MSDWVDADIRFATYTVATICPDGEGVRSPSEVMLPIKCDKAGIYVKSDAMKYATAHLMIFLYRTGIGGSGGKWKNCQPEDFPDGDSTGRVGVVREEFESCSESSFSCSESEDSQSGILSDICS